MSHNTPAKTIAHVDVLILSWNGKQHLEVCLAALREQVDPGIKWRVLVLDNGSSDGTALFVRTHYPEVELIRSEYNLGFCGGNNLLVEHSDADAVALLNNDTRPQPQWLATLVAALQDAPLDVAAVSGKILDWEGARLDFARGVMAFDGHAFQYDYRRGLDRARLPQTGAELLFACGGNMLVRRESFLAAGGFDPAYFAYLEDVDLGWRLWSGGERVLFCDQAIVHHRSMATSDKLGVFNRGYLFERNALLTAYKNFDEEFWPKLMPAVLMTHQARSLTLLVQNNAGGITFTIDPYQGFVADTAPSEAEPSHSSGVSPLASERADVEPKRGASYLRRKWKELGPREFLRRGLGRVLGVPGVAAEGALINDERTLAHVRSYASLLTRLGEFDASRKRIAQRRVRPDREIFERFPLLVVPTYPGDEELFQSQGFRSFLPKDLPLEYTTLEEVMEIEDPQGAGSSSEPP